MGSAAAHSEQHRPHLRAEVLLGSPSSVGCWTGGQEGAATLRSLLGSLGRRQHAALCSLSPDQSDAELPGPQQALASFSYEHCVHHPALLPILPGRCRLHLLHHLVVSTCQIAGRREPHTLHRAVRCCPQLRALSQAGKCCPLPVTVCGVTASGVCLLLPPSHAQMLLSAGQGDGDPPAGSRARLGPWRAVSLPQGPGRCPELGALASWAAQNPTTPRSTASD